MSTAPIKTGWLKKAVIQANTPQYSIIEALRKKLGKYEPGRMRGTLHASEVTRPGFCCREQAFLDLKEVKRYEGGYVCTALRVTYDMGNATADMLREEWAEELAIGNWRCRVCGDQRTMCPKPKNTPCKHGTCIWKYVEPVIVSVEFGISGSIDLLFDVGAPKLLLTELKTISPDEFEKIVAPHAEHRLRTNLYLKIISDSEWPYKNSINLHEGRVLYVSRAYGKKNPNHGDEILPFKEFRVERNDDDLKSYLAQAKQLKVFREEGKMPSGICATALDKRAKNCDQVKDCFSGQYPAAQEPLP